MYMYKFCDCELIIGRYLFKRKDYKLDVALSSFIWKWKWNGKWNAKSST